MTRTIQTTYRYRLTPTAAQENLLMQFAGARRWIWNWALGQRIAHDQATRRTLPMRNLEAELTRLKQQPDTAWLRAMDSQLLQQALRDLDSAYQHFFRRVKAGEQKKGFPRFKARKTDTPRFRIPQRVTLDGAGVVVPKIGRIRLVLHRPLVGVTKSATFKREPDGQWYVCLVTAQQIAPRTERPVQTHVGVDVGLITLATLSTGDTIPNPPRRGGMRRDANCLWRPGKPNRNGWRGSLKQEAHAFRPDFYPHVVVFWEHLSRSLRLAT